MAEAAAAAAADGAIIPGPGAGAAPAANPPVTFSSIGNLIIIRLTRDYFLLWNTQAVPVLRAQQLFGYVDGTTTAPAHTLVEGEGDNARKVVNPAFLRWYQQDQLVMIALLASMSEDIIGQMTQLTSAKAVWDALHDMFASRNRAHIMQIRYQISNLKKKDLTATEYFHKMKSFAYAMASTGKPLSDDETLGYMLAGLGPEYEPLVTSITSARSRSSSAPSTRSSSAPSSARNSKPPPTTSTPPKRGGQGGQQGAQGGQGGQGRNRGQDGRGRGRRSNLKCQVCSKFGHDALHCRQRFYHAYQSEENRNGNNANIVAPYTVDNNWYADTGATDHLTSDLDRLTMHERYGGKDHVQVANGAGPSNEGNPTAW